MSKENARLKLKLSTIVLVVYAIGLFTNGMIYFFWNTYMGGKLQSLLVMYSYMSIALFVFYILIKNRNHFSINKKTLKVLFACLIFQFLITCCTVQYQDYFNANIWTVLVYLILIFLLDNDERARLFYYITIIFIVVSFPSVVYFLMYSVGILHSGAILQSTHVGKIASGIIYLRYPFGLLIREATGVVRPCGIFDEPGVIGTISGLLLAAYIDMKDKKLIKVMLIVIGGLSTSFAFYVLIIIILIINAYKKGFLKFVVGCLILVGIYLLFMNLEFSNFTLSNLQDRFQIIGLGLAGNNRTGKMFDAVFNDFVAQGGAPLFLGNGIDACWNNPVMRNSSSYKCIIYDYGIIGTVLLGYILVSIYNILQQKRMALEFMIVFLASLYQRPYIYTRFYMTLFVCGVCYCTMAHKEIIKDESWKKIGIKRL